MWTEFRKKYEIVHNLPQRLQSLNVVVILIRMKHYHSYMSRDASHDHLTDE